MCFAIASCFFLSRYYFCCARACFSAYESSCLLMVGLKLPCYSFSLSFFSSISFFFCSLAASRAFSLRYFVLSLASFLSASLIFVA